MKKSFRIYLTLLFFSSVSFSCTEERYVNEPGSLVHKTVDQDALLPSILVNGALLHSEAFGPEDSTLIICIHGGPGGDYRYLLNCKTLATKGYRVVFYDQRGAGLSQRFPKSWYKSQANDALDKIFYDELKGVIAHYKTSSAQKVILLGQSWGAMLATAYTGKYPTEINGLIVAEPGGLEWDDVVNYISVSRSFKLWSETLNDATYIDQFMTGKEDQHEILDYKAGLMGSTNAIVGDLGSDLGNNAPSYVASRSGAVVNAASYELGQEINPDFSAGINQFLKKVLFIYSSNNKAYPDSWAEKISSAYPKKEIFKAQGVGHSGMFDQISFWTTTMEPKIISYIQSL
ncbi:proline iminopeptidase [Lacibacter cauensis]|uniref:Proline iminopeptidase n=1 Tax=Lacibacter cauensis TaxID=510947 RepID=A0A562SBL5_9BACT|nr:alpha/beta fold hydrolase [Lacibacter cauensis]TWI78016.1 proline iminopeptidase [Lacibacter cauensis]